MLAFCGIIVLSGQEPTEQKFRRTKKDEYYCPASACV